MTDQKALRLLMNRVLEVKPRYGDIVSNGIPGMGMPNMGADLINRLRRTAGLFAKAYADLNATTGEVKCLAEQLEADLLVVATFGVSDDSSTEAILDQLHKLVTSRQPMATD